LGRAGHGITKTFRGGIHGRPEAVIIAGLELIARKLPGCFKARRRNQPVAVMALANTLFEELRLLTKRHRPQLDVRNAGSCAHPDATSVVGNQIENLVVGQVAQAGKVLAAIERTGVVVDTHGGLSRAVPQSPVASSPDATCLTLR